MRTPPLGARLIIKSNMEHSDKQGKGQRISRISFVLTLLFIVLISCRGQAAVYILPTLTEINSQTTGTIGGDDTVWIKATATNAIGATVSQYGTAGYLTYQDRSAPTITTQNQQIWVRYKCTTPGTNLQLTLRLIQNNQATDITKTITCNGQNPFTAQLTEINSQTTGTIGGDDTVWIKASATNAVGATVSQYGTPGYLSYQDRSASAITNQNQQIWVRYKCTTPGTNMQLTLRLIQNNQATDITKTITCTGTAANIYLQEKTSDLSGTVGDTNTVLITATAINANGMTVTQYGQPGFLSYVGRTAGTITSDNQVVTVVYKCIAPGTGIPFSIGLVQNGQIVRQITKTVTCTEQNPITAQLTEINSQTTGTIGGDDTVWIKATATNAVGATVSQYGTPGYLTYQDRSTPTITTQNQQIWVRYKCITPGTDLQLTLRLIQNNQATDITKTITCTGQSSGATFQEVSSDTVGSVGSDADTVSITARAYNANGMRVSQWGEPGYLAYVGRTADYVTGDGQDIMVTYKCIAAGTSLLYKITIFNENAAKEISKRVTCLGPTLTDITSKTTGTVGSDTDIVWIKATAVNAVGAAISQWGQPGYLSYSSSSASSVTAANQQIIVAYKCVSAGSDLSLKLSLLYGGNARTASVSVSCKGTGSQDKASLKIISSKSWGSIETSDDQVWIKMKATNAAGMIVGQWGDPGYLKYVSRSAGTISGDGQDVTVTYKCVNPGSNIRFRTYITQNGVQIAQAQIFVSCSGGPVETVETSILQMMNTERKAQNPQLTPLAMDTGLRDIARAHSKDMAKTGIQSHVINGKDYSDRYKDAGYSCAVRVGNVIYGGAENVGCWGRASFSSPEEMAMLYMYGGRKIVNGIDTTFVGFMQSPEHRANILSPVYTRVGVGVDIESGYVGVTEDFC